MLRKLAGQALKPDQRRHRPAAQHLRQAIQRGLAARVPGAAGAMEQLHRPQRRVVCQRREQDLPKRLGLRGAANLPPVSLRVIIDRRDRVLVHDPSDRPDGRAAERRHVRQRVARPPEHLNLVSLEHVDHPFPRRIWSLRRLSALGRLQKGDQNFRKSCDQNYRNPQVAIVRVVTIRIQVQRTLDVSRNSREPGVSYCLFDRREFLLACDVGEASGHQSVPIEFPFENRVDGIGESRFERSHTDTMNSKKS